MFDFADEKLTTEPRITAEHGSLRGKNDTRKLITFRHAVRGIQKTRSSARRYEGRQVTKQGQKRLQQRQQPKAKLKLEKASTQQDATNDRPRTEELARVKDYEQLELWTDPIRLVSFKSMRSNYSPGPCLPNISFRRQQAGTRHHRGQDWVSVMAVQQRIRSVLSKIGTQASNERLPTGQSKSSQNKIVPDADLMTTRRSLLNLTTPRQALAMRRAARTKMAQEQNFCKTVYQHKPDPMPITHLPCVVSRCSSIESDAETRNVAEQFFRNRYSYSDNASRSSQCSSMSACSVRNDLQSVDCSSESNPDSGSESTCYSEEASESLRRSGTSHDQRAVAEHHRTCQSNNSRLSLRTSAPKRESPDRSQSVQNLNVSTIRPRRTCSVTSLHKQLHLGGNNRSSKTPTRISSEPSNPHSSAFERAVSTADNVRSRTTAKRTTGAVRSRTCSEPSVVHFAKRSDSSENNSTVNVNRRSSTMSARRNSFAEVRVAW